MLLLCFSYFELALLLSLLCFMLTGDDDYDYATDTNDMSTGKEFLGV